jgi:CubicO group peptidase (beta-lactamase class C family)
MAATLAFPDARRVIYTGLESRAFPAAAVDVGRAAGSIWRDAFGRLTYDSNAPECDLDTIFDLASLTKVIATASIAMQHIGAGRLAIDAPLADVLSSWRDRSTTRVTVRNLMEHSSGLPAHARLWEQAAGRAEYERVLTSLPLEREPGGAAVYSDPGFMLLGFALEDLGHAPLDRQFAPLAALVDEPLLFRPSADLRERIAPTENDPWRGRVLQGEVHDENAAALGGVAAHAGLFGTAGAVAAFARLVLNTFHAPTALGTPDLMRQFARRSNAPGSSRALAWDTMLPTSSCGTLMSPTAMGHTGFTGTSLWIDWERDLYVVLLTNRVHPTRANDALVKLRPKVHNAILASAIGESAIG